MKDDRRAFLRTVGGASAAVAGVSALGAPAQALPESLSRSGGDGLQAAASRPGYQASHFALELDGILIALRSFSGGHASAEVVQQENSDCVVRKGLGSVHYADLVLALAALPGPEVQDWINEMLSCETRGRSGAILSLDPNYRELRRLEFRNALLTEVSLPALEGGAKEPFVFTLRCQPESTVLGKGSGETIKLSISKAKLPLTSNFSITFKGLETKKVTRVDSLKITRPVIPAEAEGKGFSIPGKVDVGDLHLTLLESAADSWYKWHQSFVIEGNNGDEAEQSATIELLAPNLTSTLLTVQLAGLGIYGLESASSEANKAGTVVAHLYCEEAGFKF